MTEPLLDLAILLTILSIVLFRQALGLEWGPIAYASAPVVAVRDLGQTMALALWMIAPLAVLAVLVGTVIQWNRN